MYKIILLIAFLFSGCGGGSSTTSSNTNSIFDSSISAITSGIWYKPSVDSSWQIQLSDKDETTDVLDYNSSYNVDIYEIDLFDASIDDISNLHNDNRKVICYFSAGSFEDWRDDAALFSDDLIGKALDGWDGEYWLDISNDKLASIMQARLDLAVSKDCDAVEFDNIDTYTQDSGFALSANDQLAYNKFLANEARSRGLSAGLKNDLGQIEDLVDYFDFAVNEQCHEYDECDTLAPFIDANKPVFNLEYKDEYVNNTNGARDTICQESSDLGLYTLIMPLNLNDEFRISCD